MRIFIIFLLACFQVAAFSSELKTETVKSTTLGNGLNVLVKEDHRAPVAVSMIWYNVGSKDEHTGKTGLSHALEHLMFKGTPKYALGQFSKIVAENGGQENAFTNYDYTAYFENMAVSRLDISFELEADRMQHLLIQPEEFRKEMKVIREERRMRTDDNPQALTFERFMAQAYLTIPYHHPVIGWMQDLKTMKAKDLRKWYEHYYTPNNATLVVVGDVEAEKVFAMAKKYFGDIKARKLPKRERIAEPKQLGLKAVQVNAPAKLPMVMLGYSVPSAASAKDSKEPYALEMIAGILDAGESARLSKDLIRGKALASDADVYYDLYSKYPGQFILYGIPVQNKTTAKLKASLLGEIERLQTEPVGKEELQRVKNQLIAQKTFEKDSIFGQAMEIGLLETIGLGWQAAAEYNKKINDITPLDIQKAAQLYFQEIALTKAELIPLAPGRTQ